MSKKFIAFFLALFMVPFFSFAGEISDKLAGADQAFDKEEFTVAMQQYEELYAEGYFTEKMLYRMAFMHENLKNYPAAIYYLKKAAQEYGNEGSDAKIKQMMQMNGSSRIFTADGWDAYFLFFNQYGTWLWIGFAVLALGLSASIFLPRRKPNSIRSVGLVGGWTLFAILGIFFVHHLIFTPHRAVLIQETSFYTFPSYAARSMPNIFSLGETVAITDQEDIWSLVEAGGREFWVPNWVLRDL
jgi:hypothetical protein